jgi:hypothetical protein
VLTHTLLADQLKRNTTTLEMELLSAGSVTDEVRALVREYESLEARLQGVGIGALTIRVDKKQVPAAAAALPSSPVTRLPRRRSESSSRLRRWLRRSRPSHRRSLALRLHERSYA